MAGEAKSSAHRAARSDAMKGVARAGLGAHGLVWILLGVLAVFLAVTPRSPETDQRGALEELTDHTGGSALLLIIAIGLVAYALWRLVDAAVGGGEVKDRVSAVVRAVIYGGLAISAFQILADGNAGSQKRTQQSWSAKIMQHTGGRWFIGLVGVIIVGVGIYLLYDGLSKKVLEGMATYGLPRGARQVITWSGIVGSTARGVVVGLAGVLTVVAAVDYDPKKASGVDGALRTVRDGPAGPLLLGLVAAGLIVFGIFGLCEAKYRQV